MALFRKPEPLQSFTFPTRVVEILGLGKLLIMNDFGDLSKYFIDGENSILFSSKIEDLNSEKIIDVHKIEIHSRLVKNGFVLLKNEFNATVQVKKILNLI